MRLIKLFGLAAIAAVAATAFVGASSAMAGDTALCSSNEGGALACAGGNLVTELHGVSVTPPTLLTEGPLADVLCKSSLSKASVLSQGNPLVVHLEELTWKECHDEKGVVQCTVENKLLGLGQVLKTAANLATVSAPEAAVLVSCGDIVKCTYKLAAGATLHGLGAVAGVSNGHLTASNVAVVEAALSEQPLARICPKSTWDALYENLTPVYIKS